LGAPPGLCEASGVRYVPSAGAGRVKPSHTVWQLTNTCFVFPHKQDREFIGNYRAVRGAGSAPSFNQFKNLFLIRFNMLFYLAHGWLGSWQPVD